MVATDSAYVIEIELPGVRRGDVDVELNGNDLVVTGELKAREREGLFCHRSRRVGHFEYRVTLPGYLRDGDIEASLAYGVLTALLVSPVRRRSGASPSRPGYQIVAAM